MQDFKEKIRNIIAGNVNAAFEDNDPLSAYATEGQVGDIQGEIEEEFGIVFDEDDLETLDELTLDSLVTRVTDLGGKLPE